MAQLLESTRSFLKTSTRLGRRMSSQKDESADSSTATETSSNTDHNLHYYSNSSTVRAASAKEDPATHRPSTHKRLSGLFSRKSLSEENPRPSTPMHGRGTGGGVTVGGAKIGPDEAQEVMMIVPDDNTSGQLQAAHQRHIVLDVGTKDAEARRRDSKSSERTHPSIKSRQSHYSQLSNGSKNGGSRTEKNNGAENVAALVHHQDGSSSSPERQRRSRRHHEHASAHMENEVPRGRSPTLSMSNSVSTSSSSYGGHSPSFSMTHNEDPASSSLHSFSQPSPSSNSSSAQNNRLHQSHVWRRNLLEESIMHSLRLGYADRQRSSSRHGFRHQNSGSSDSQGHGSMLPRKKSSRARKTREQAILAAAMGKELPPFPVAANATSPSGSSATAGSSHDIILDRSIQGGHSRQNHNNVQSGQTTTTRTGGNQFLNAKNSPYQLDNYSHSMTNIRNSIASFTLELPEHRASHVMASSMIPNLFRVKGRSSHTPHSASGAAANAVAAATSTLALIAEGTSSSSRPRSRRNSRAHMGAVSLGPSPRVLPGGAIKKPLPPLQIVDPLFPGSSNASIRPKSVLSAEGDDQEDDEPVSPATQDWVESVFASLDQVKGYDGQDQTNAVVPVSIDNIAQLKRDSTRGVSVSS